MDVVTAVNLVKTYPGGVTGLNGISVSVQAGEMVGLLGPSGAGKTTFLRLLNGSLTPTGGSLKVMGQEMGRIPVADLRKIRRRLAIIHQNYNVVPGLSVAHNVQMGSLGQVSFYKVLRTLIYLTGEEQQAILRVLSDLGIEEKIFERCTELSGGQQQRVAVARALLANPEIILADEPVASVDTRTGESILNCFQRLNQEQGKTIIINLHQVDFALRYCRRVLVLERGMIVYDGPPEEIKSRVHGLSGSYGSWRGVAEDGRQAAICIASNPLF